MLRYDHSIFIMDEIEDTVPWDKHFRDDSGVSKSWFNNALEANPVCTIWISNCAKQMDPAFLRRFSYCLHVTIPGEKKRASLIRKHLKRNCVSVDPGTVTMLAKQQFLSPAHIQSTDVILSTISTGEMGDGMTEKVFLNKLQAAGLVDHSILRKNADTKRCDYYPQYSNTSISLEEMAINLGKVSEGRYCLYGPAGTGKTGFVKYLADRLKKPVLQRTASDLLGQYVGQTEQAISAMFKEAKRTEAILLLDEADSFLTDRNGHLRSWETTQVNELLVQMEQYDGLFFCCTNRIESFDKAAARRFDFKIAFDYLRPQQIEGLFRDTLPSADKPDLTQLDRIKRLRNLTPADFEIARRKARLSDHRINSGWLSEQLTEESKFRGDDKANPIGFHPC